MIRKGKFVTFSNTNDIKSIYGAKADVIISLTGHKISAIIKHQLKC